MQLLGRDDELRSIAQLLEAARSGRSGALVVSGEAGMGKSALLGEVSRLGTATAMRVAEVRGVAGESDYGFAGLQRLLVPFMSHYGSLPAPQHDALGAAIGLAGSSAPDRFLIGLATLTLMSDGTDRPTLIVIDDAHVLDRESLDIVAFVARRLLAESLAVVVATRPDDDVDRTLEGIERLEVGPLSADATTRVLSDVSGCRVASAAGRAIAKGTAGCPLAIVELGRALSSGHLLGTQPLPDPLPIGDRLEAMYLDRIRTLPASTQQMLLLAAADPEARLATVLAAAGVLGVEVDALDAAHQMGLVESTDTITFRHPLVRSAVYGGAGPADRRRAHAALAQVTDPETEPDPWVWHRAHASAVPDEEVASALEDRAVEAARRGRYAARAALLSRSAELTADLPERLRRTVAAANAHFVAGDPRQADTHLQGIDLEDAGPLTRARATRLQVTLSSRSRPADSLPLLLGAAQALEPLDAPLSQVTYAEGLYMAALSSHLAQIGLPEQLAVLSVASLEPDDASVIGEVIRALAARLTGDHLVAAGLMRCAMQSMTGRDLPAEFPHWSGVGSMLATDLLDVDMFQQFMRRRAEEERSRGALELLRGTVATQANGELWSGRFDAAAAMWAEAGEISRSIGDHSSVWKLLGLELSAWRDDDDICRAVIEGMRSNAVVETRAGLMVNNACLALAVLENSLGNYAAAADAAWPVFQRDPIASGARILPELVEAASRCGRRDAADEALLRLRARAEACGTAWAAGLHARAEGIMAGEDAEPHFIRSVSQLASTVVRTDLARSRLVYGEWLRRQQRRRDARVELAAAHEMFVDMGAPRFAARAATELAATGVTARPRERSTSTELTPQEEAIARLAAGPETNREIAAKLFVSASTVDYHLRKVYRKLGVDSRRKLAEALDR